MATSIAKLGIVVEAEGVQNAQAQLQQLSATGQLTTQKLVYLANAGGEVSKSMTRVDTSFKGVVRSGFSAVAIMGEFGPVGRIAAQALTAMTLAAGPVAIAFGAVAAAIAFVSYRIEGAREKFRNIAEREMKDLAREAQSLKSTLETKTAVKILESADPEMARLTQSFESLRSTQEKLGASTQELALIDKKYALESAQLIDERSRGLKEQISLLQAVGDPLAQNAIRMESSMRGMDDSTRKLGTTLLGLQNSASLVSAGTGALENAMAKLGTMANLLQPAFRTATIEAGRLRLEFDQGKISAEKYQEGLRSIASQAAISKDKPFVDQISKIRAELNEMAKTPGQVQGSVFDIWSGQRVPTTTGFDLLADKLRQLQENARLEFGLDIPPNITSAIGSLQGQLEQLKQTKVVLDLSTSTALTGLGEVSHQLDLLRAKAAQPIIVTVETMASGSPTLTFSDYFQQYAPGVIKDFSSKAAQMMNLTLDSGILALIHSSMNELNRATQNVQSVTRTGYNPDYWGAETASIRTETAFLSFVQSMMKNNARAGGSAAPGGGAGSIYIDLRGAQLSADFIDTVIIPRLESFWTRTTGQAAQTRVLN